MTPSDRSKAEPPPNPEPQRGEPESPLATGKGPGVRLYLIRHPKPAVAEGVCYGRSELDLAEDAAAVVARLKPLLPADAPLYTSPLRRCRLLADALHAAPQIDARLTEMHFGEWEMQPWEAIGRDAVDAWAADPLGYAPPGGESAAALLARVAEFADELEGSGSTQAILVVHAGVMKALCGHRQQLPARSWMKLAFEFGSITLLEGSERLWHNAGHV